MNRRTTAAYVLSAGLIAATGAGALVATASSKPTGSTGAVKVRHVVPTSVVTRVVDVFDPAPPGTNAGRAAAPGPSARQEPSTDRTPVAQPGPSASVTEPPSSAPGETTPERPVGTVPAHTETTEAHEPSHPESGESEHEHEYEHEHETDSESHGQQSGGSTDAQHRDD